MPLSKPTNGSNADYANRIGLLFDAVNNGNYPFPATAVPSADPNTLDDYEEGDWTPSLGGTATYTSRFGKYTKIGRLFHLNAQIVVNTIGTGSTGSIAGSPFTPSNNSGGNVSYFAGSATNYTYVGVYLSTGSSIDTAAIAAAGASMTTPAVLFGSGTNVQFSVVGNV